jgi:hypothetical protein
MKMALNNEMAFQCGLKKFSLDYQESGSIQPPMLVTPEQIRHCVVHSKDSRCLSGVGCSFVKDSIQVSVTK